jgi:hypothetical protein
METHMTKHSRKVLLALAVVYLAIPQVSAAQGLQAVPVSSQVPALRMPTVMVSAGFGSANDPRGAEESNLKPMQMFSVQFLPTRHFAMEAEFGRWETVWDRRLPNPISFAGGQAISGERVLSGAIEGWSAGMNLLYRTEPRRVSAFVGGGSFFGSERYAENQRVEGCVPQAAIRDPCPPTYESDSQDSAWRFQAVTGADVQVAGPLRAYGSVQFTTMGHAYFRWSGGVRVVAVSRSAAPRAAGREPVAPSDVPSADRQAELRGKQVRVTFADGARTQMRFVAIDGVALTAEGRGQNDTYSLDRIATVETVHHTARRAAIIGAIAGFVGGYLWSCGGGDEEDCWPEIGALFAGISAGTGALIGAGYDAATSSRHVIYAGARNRSASLMPLITQRGGGVGVAVSF